MAQYEDLFPTTESNLLYALLKGSSLQQAVGYDEQAVTDSAATSLGSIPTTAQSAWLVLETDGGEVNPARACRFLMLGTGTLPTVNDGLPLGDNGTLRLENPEQMSSFRIIAIDSGVTHSLKVQYLG